MHSVVNQICLAIFLAFSYLDYKNKEENYSQPNVLAVKSRECLVKMSKMLPQSLLMILTSENLNFCKVQPFLRYHVLNRKQHSEIFVHYLLFMFFFFHFEMKVRSRLTMVTAKGYQKIVCQITLLKIKCCLIQTVNNASNANNFSVSLNDERLTANIE